jgi:phosphatidylglycerophosphatase A
LQSDGRAYIITAEMESLIRATRRTIATFFGLGFFPLAPGTLTSFAVVLLYKVLAVDRRPLVWPLAAVAVLIVLGGLAAAGYARELNQRDPGRIVVDEACGQLIALVGLPSSWQPLLVSFVLFRGLDILKPNPIRKLEVLPWGWGIMADDIAAGLAAGLLTHGLFLILP